MSVKGGLKGLKGVYKRKALKVISYSERFTPPQIFFDWRIFFFDGRSNPRPRKGQHFATITCLFDAEKVLFDA